MAVNVLNRLDFKVAYGELIDLLSKILVPF